MGFVAYLLKNGKDLYVLKDNQSLLIKAATANALEVAELVLDLEMDVI